MNKRMARVLLVAFTMAIAARSTYAQVVQPPFTNDYSVVDLGSVPGVPANYGGLTFKLNDPDTILIGGAANGSAGLLYAIPVVRGFDSHITGFNGTATVFAAAAYNDGGVVYGPSNVLFLARWNINEIGQTKFGSTNTDKIISLATLSISTGPGGLNFVPAGFPGAGQLKMAAYSDYKWYTLDIAPDGAGTFDITNVYHCPGNAQLPMKNRSPFNYFNGVRAAYIAAGGQCAAVNARQILFPAAYVLSGDTIDNALYFTLDDADKDDYSQNCVGGEVNGTPSVEWKAHNNGQDILFADAHVKWYKGYKPDEMTFRYESIHGWQ